VKPEDLLKEVVRRTLEETVTVFDEWMSPDVMEILIRTYAKAGGVGALGWEYAPLRARVWGEFRAGSSKLYVNKSKTNGLFKQQVQTILHEIQHWNQYVEVAKNAGSSPLSAWSHVYNQETKAKGYWKNSFEVDARRFADLHLEEAMAMLGKHYGGKVEGGSYDRAVEEIFDEYEDAGVATRAQVGAALKAHDSNSPENMKKAIEMLADLGIKVR